jgi:hypothetical protein
VGQAKNASARILEAAESARKNGPRMRADFVARILVASAFNPRYEVHVHPRTILTIMKIRHMRQNSSGFPIA